MAASQLHLLKSRRLLPLFVTQFLGSMNDNVLRAALVTIATYHAFAEPTTTRLFVAVATSILVFPYFPFSATAGQLADKYEKASLIRWIKLWEIGVMVLAAVGFTFEGTAFL